jgi:hypothetical protein
MISKFKFLIILLYTAIIFSPQLSFCQQLSLRPGPVQPGDNLVYIRHIIGQTENGFYAWAGRVGKNRFYLMKFDTNNQLVFNNQLTLKTDAGHDLDFEDLLMVNKRLVLFTSFFNWKTEKKTLYATFLDANGDADGNTIVIDDSAVKDKNRSFFYYFALSADSRMVLIYRKDYSSSASTKLILFDADIKRVWEKNPDSDFGNDRFSENGFAVSNSGKVYTIGYVQKESGGQDYQYNVICYDTKNKEVEVKRVPITEEILTDVKFKADARGNIICAGFFTLKNTAEKWRGVFYIRLDDESGQVKQKCVEEFSPDIIKKLKPNWNTDDNSGFYHLKDIVFLDGRSVLVGEFQFETTTSVGKSSFTDDYYTDIALISVKGEDCQEWVSVIPKLQMAPYYNTSALSAAICVYNDKVLLFYNDNSENLAVTAPDKLTPMRNPAKSVLTAVTVDSRGQYSKSILKDNNGSKVYMRPQIQFQPSENRMVMYGMKGKTMSFDFIDIK